MSAWNAERFLECVTEGTIDLFVPVGNEIKLDAEFEVNGVTVHLQGIIDRVFFDDGGYIPLNLRPVRGRIARSPVCVRRWLFINFSLKSVKSRFSLMPD